MDAHGLFEILARENSTMLWAYVRAAVWDEHAAEDVFQETLTVAWRRIDDYDRTRPFAHWLRGIARKLIIKHIRKKGTRAMALADEAALDDLSARLGRFEDPSQPFDERLDALQVCMGELDERDQTIIRGHYHDGLECQQIAPQLGMSVEAVKKRLQRARAAIAVCIEGRMAREAIHGS